MTWWTRSFALVALCLGLVACTAPGVGPAANGPSARQVDTNQPLRPGPGAAQVQTQSQPVSASLNGGFGAAVPALPPTAEATGTGVIVNDDTLQAALVGDTSINEGGSGFYRIDLAKASDVDRVFDIQINDGSANRIDQDGSNQDIIWGGYYDVRYVSTGEVVRVVEDRIPGAAIQIVKGRIDEAADVAMWKPKRSKWTRK